MNLESLKIYGFKSFADEVNFTFDKGMTVIVGPNGCGKSNVLDAINWVLGEQSPGRLRGEKMEDMIFMGSQTRKPIGVSSVEFCVDNASGLLPVDYSKVTIKRKLYRSGESEYFINKNPCRLKDIKELFMDTGVGTQSYSVMNQGDVSFILKCTAEERRSIIEEAAGIRKYKERKETAQRRLERTKSDLDEVKNILGEVKKNIRRLKRQSARAARYRKYREKLSYLEVSRLCQRYVSLKKSLDSTVKESGGMKEKLALLNASKSSLDSSVSSKEEEKADIDEKIISLSRNLFSVESRIEIIGARVENFDSELKRLDEEIKRSSESRSFCQERIKLLKNDLKDTEANKDSRAEIKLKEKEGLLAEKTAEVKSKEKEREVLARKIEKKENKLSDERTLYSELKRRIENINYSGKTVREKFKTLEETLNKLNEELKEKDALIEKTEREIEFQGKKLNQMIKEEDSVNQEISDSEVQRERFLQEYHKRKSEFDSGKKYLPQLLSMQELAKSGISGIDGPLISVLEKNLSKDEIKKVTARAGEKISWMTAESESVALAAVKFLSAKNLPPLTFILTDSLPAESGGFVCKGAGALYERIIGFITAGTRIKNNIVYKSGCILRGGGEFPVRAGRLPGLEKEVQTVRKNLSERESFLERLRKKREGILKERRETESKLGQLKDRLSDLKQKKSNLKGRSEITGKEFKVIKEKIKEFSDKQELLLSAGKQESKIEGLSENLIKLKKEKNIMEDAIRELKISSAGLEAKINILSDSISRKLSRKRELKDSISQSEKEAERLKNLIKDLNAHRQNIISRNTEDIKELDSLKNKKKKEQAGTGELQNFKSRITSELKSLKAKQRDKELEIQRFKDMEAEEKQAEEILREKIKGIKVRLKEDMGRDLEQALKDYSRRAVSDDEIRDLKIKLERIGNVNLEAPEEFEKENQRFEFIKKHVDDLEEADRNLKNIIRKINNQTKDRFISSFNTINKNFNRVFNRLFEGGRAGLYLSEPDKILESGVEISAMPEGKKINSLKQLSGGEKALTAIALMFAVFEVKPSPFCILDEVDSPLDDVNLHRFLRMLRDYSEKTQFILITHNKQTMQESDTFYGITMEEFGVSKVISVNLKDVKSSSA